MNMSTPKKRINTNNHIPMPLTYSLYRSSALFKHQHQLLSSLGSPFMPSLRVQKKVSEFDRGTNLKLDQSFWDMNQQQQIQIQKNQFLHQLLEPSKKLSPNHHEFNTNKVPLKPVITLNPNNSKKTSEKPQQQQQQQSYQAPVKDIFNCQQSINKQDNKPVFIPLKLGDCFKIQQKIPEEVTQIYTNYKKNNKKQPNFIQGYINKIDCIYYAVEKNLILHFPSGIRNNLFGMPNTCISVKLPDILYNIVQTQLRLSLFEQTCIKQNKKKYINNNENGQILIMCHPYYIQLYYLAFVNRPNSSSDCNTNNPIQKLDIRYYIPNCPKPSILGISDTYIYYLPHKSCINLEYVNLQTAQINKMNAKKVKNKHRFNTSQPIQQKNQKNKQQQLDNKQHRKLSTFLLSKLASFMMYSNSQGLMHKIGQKLFINTQPYKIIICQHNTNIGCILDLKTKNYIQKLFHQSDIKHKYKYIKLVRIYSKINNHKYIFEDILYQNNNIQIIDIQFYNDNRITNQCHCKLKLQTRNKQQSIIQQYIHPQPSQNINIITSIKLSQQQSQTIPIVIKTTKYTLIKQQTNLTVIPNHNNRSSIQKYNAFGNNKQNIQQYMHTNGNYITICTDTGYTRLFTINWIDLLYSAIVYYTSNINTIESTQDIATMASYFIKLSLDSYAQDQTNPNNKLQAIVKLFNGLVHICSNAYMDDNILLYRYNQKDNNIIIRAVNTITDRINKACISLLNYYSVYLNKYIIQIIQYKHIKHILQHTVGTSTNTHTNTNGQQKGQQKQNIIFKYNKIKQYMYTKYLNKQQQSQQNQQNTNKQQQKCKLQQQFKGIILKIFKQQQQAKHDRTQLSTTLATILYKYSFLQYIHHMLQPICYQPLRNVSLHCIQGLLHRLDNITTVSSVIQKSLGCSIFSIYDSIIHNKQSTIHSPSSTIAYSNKSIQGNNQCQIAQNTAHRSQTNKNSSIVQKICQILMMGQITHSQCTNLSFKDILNKQPSYFEPYIFNKFVEDYDNQLLVQFQKTIPMYLNARDKQIQYGNQYAYYMPLKFWLVLFVDICPILNKIKILIILQNKLQNYNLIRIHQIVKKIQVKQKKDHKIVIVPEYFINYLWKRKGITFNDLQLKNLTQKRNQDESKVIIEQASDKKTQQNQNKIKKLQTLNQIKDKQKEIAQNNNNKTKKSKQAINLSQLIQKKASQLNK